MTVAGPNFSLWAGTADDVGLEGLGPACGFAGYRGSRYGRGYDCHHPAASRPANRRNHRQTSPGVRHDTGQIDFLIMELRKDTPLHRLPLQEAKQIFEALLAWGYVLTAPATPPAEK